MSLHHQARPFWVARSALKHISRPHYRAEICAIHGRATCRRLPQYYNHIWPLLAASGRSQFLWPHKAGNNIKQQYSPRDSFHWSALLLRVDGGLAVQGGQASCLIRSPTLPFHLIWLVRRPPRDGARAWHEGQISDAEIFPTNLSWNKTPPKSITLLFYERKVWTKWWCLCSLWRRMCS